MEITPVPRPNIRKILYASDLGKYTRPVFRLAVSQARRYDAQILMLHVVSPLGATAESIVGTYLGSDNVEKIQRDGLQQVLATMKTRLAKFCEDELAAYQLKRVPVTEILVVCESDPSFAILKVAKEHEVDMIIMGKSTHTFFGSTVMGTTARRVSRHAQVPLLLVPNVD